MPAITERQIERAARSAGIKASRNPVPQRDPDAAYRAICAAVADRAHAALAAGPGREGPLYLWCRPVSATRPGALAVGWEPPQGHGPLWERVSFRPHRPVEEFGWLARGDFALAVWWAARSAPILGRPVVEVIGHDGSVQELPT